MPDPNSSAAAHPIQLAVEAQFRSRPTLRSVTTNLLGQGLREKYPTLVTTVSDLRLALPREGGGRTLLPLLEATLQHLADGSVPDFSARHGLDCYLSGATGNRLSYQIDGRLRDYDLGLIEAVIRELPSILFIAFQEALATYWGQDSDAGASRWKWLAEVLQGSLLESATRQASGTAQHLNTLNILNRYPDRAVRARRPAPDSAVHAYTVQTHLLRSRDLLTLQATDILVVCREQVLLCRLSGEIEPYSDLDAFGQAWGERLQQRFTADSITWQQYEPDGNIFEVQAALILNQQLDDLAAIQLPARSTVQALEQRFAVITKPTQWLARSALTPLASLTSLQATLPARLQSATAAERLAYRQCLLEQAGIRRLTLGDSDFDGLETLRGYAAEHLNQQLCLDRAVALGGPRRCDHNALSAGYQADDLQLTFHVPVGDLRGGYIEPVVMSLVDLALQNLSGRPKGALTLGHRTGRAIETWLTPAYVLELVQRVNIGRNYPAYLRRELTSDTEAARKRQQLFQQLRPVHLKTQALECLFKGEAGLTFRGFRCVSALVNTNPLDRQVDGDEIVIRSLAFLRSPGATADVARNMFIIEPRDTQLGPHLLYRPAYRDALLEYASRDQLLAAIVQPGPVQESVLTWLTDHARPIYSNGGFAEPHILRIGIGSDFDRLPSVPKPAELAKAGDVSSDEILQALSNGSLMEYLFGSETRQLVDQAERESTSNSESRWAVIVEGFGLAFNTLLLVIRGPLATVGWLMQATQGLVQDLPALESDDPTARELAWIDLLLNISMLLLHHGSLTAPLEGPSLDEQGVTREPFKRPTGQITKQPVVERGTIGLPSEPPGGGHTLLDFDHSVAGDGSAAALLEKLRAVNVPWPVPAPEPINIGLHKGLYSIDGLMHGSVSGLLFRVRIVPGFNEVFIIHPLKTDHPGIKLKTDGNGHWSLDRGLKLLGGGPKRIAALREENQRRKAELLARMNALNEEVTHLMAPFLSSITGVSSALDTLSQQRKTVQLVRNLLQKAANEQKPVLEGRHQTETFKHQQLRTQFKILVGNLEVQFAQSLTPRLEMVKLGQELERVGGAAVHVHDRAKILKTIWDQQLFINEMLLGRLNALHFSSAGEPMEAMAGRMFVESLLGDRSVYDEYIRNASESADIREHMAEVSTAMETTLQQLEEDSVAGRTIRDQLLATIKYPQNFFPDNLKLNALNYLAVTSVEMSQVWLPPQEDLYVKRLERNDLYEALLSHVEVRSSNEYPLAEQRDVYETALNTYRRHEVAIRALKTLSPRRLRPEAERLLTGLEYAQSLAQTELEAVVRKQEALEVKLPLSKTLRAKAATKRVFKTRNKSYLIGDLKPADAQNAEEHFTITDTLTGQTVASFSKHVEGWEAIPREAAPAPPPTPAGRSLATLKGLARALIEQRKGIEQLITTEQKKLDSPLTRQQVTPSDWDELLSRQAKDLTALADEIKRTHPDKPTAQALIDEYLAQARDMTRLAESACSDAYKRQWPTQESLKYLWDHRQIDINLTSTADPQRPTLSGDFFTEYAVYDKAKKPPTVLWYAHFHYASADASPSSYTRAHLKLMEQRKYTQKDLLKQHVQANLRDPQAPGAQPVTNILYVLITPPVDNLFLAIAPAPRANP
ncbi:hypothetical protein CI807_24015 [Pseudomonas sp. NS1(2017)]|uniref:dermonecrotic toxin domain-containing protein n=1 Tax=Pseudomonas sp. NS1(2017) TaxID=2025658 RepID=UPI000BA2660C|nr:DUF6543 domain-containing protein [Pseudomonas sp. NS1(2017)]ASV39140.1 hypothetical protein CI807_24015 [Pseudomonas sp. NS1(2017)]